MAGKGSSCTGHCGSPCLPSWTCWNLGEVAELGNCVCWLPPKPVICITVKRNKRALYILKWSKFYLWNKGLLAVWQASWKEHVVSFFSGTSRRLAGCTVRIGCIRRRPRLESCPDLRCSGGSWLNDLICSCQDFMVLCGSGMSCSQHLPEPISGGS